MSTVEEVLRRRGITELLHFTTNMGATGILADGEVLPRSELPTERHLASVYPPNARVRYDTADLDCVNLSITRINQRFFQASSSWHSHEDVWWCALAFDPVVATGPGVRFGTTNNRYSGCVRAAGAAGLEALFSPRVHQYLGNYVDREDDAPANWPTDRQAEVLHRGALSTDHLRRIYVMSSAHEDVLASSAAIFGRAAQVEVRPGAFI